MTFNVNTQTLNNLGLDRSVLKEVSQEIMKRAAEKNSQYQNTTASTATTKISGLDLYKGKVDSTTAKQIATNNSQFQVQLNSTTLASVQYLNSKAAQNVSSAVEGKMTISTNETQEVSKIVSAMPQFNSIISFASDKDKNSSNTPYRGELLFGNKENESEDSVKNIFNRVF
ncbi:MAG: hypothetical protein R3Y28_02370 [Candidatus Gastranaerophilales bacterium]